MKWTLKFLCRLTAIFIDAENINPSALIQNSKQKSLILYVASSNHKTKQCDMKHVTSAGIFKHM